jgi:hypothetical protein
MRGQTTGRTRISTRLAVNMRVRGKLGVKVLEGLVEAEEVGNRLEDHNVLLSGIVVGLVALPRNLQTQGVTTLLFVKEARIEIQGQGSGAECPNFLHLVPRQIQEVVRNKVKVVRRLADDGVRYQSQHVPNRKVEGQAVDMRFHYEVIFCIAWDRELKTFK